MAYCQQSGYSRDSDHSREPMDPTKHPVTYIPSAATATRAITSLAQTMPADACTSQSGIYRAQYPAKRSLSPVTRPVPYLGSTIAKRRATDYPMHAITQSTMVSRCEKKSVLWRFLIECTPEWLSTGARYGRMPGRADGAHKFKKETTRGEGAHHSKATRRQHVSEPASNVKNVKIIPAAQ